MKIGGIDITALNLGTTPVQEVWRGDIKIWPNAVAPEAPNLYLISKTTNSIRVGWNAVEGAENYLLDLNGQLSEIMGSNFYAFSFTNLDPNTIYSIRMRAENSAGRSGYSNALGVVTDLNPPSEYPVLSVNDFDTDSISLSWTAVEGANNYQLKVKPPGGSSYIVVLNTTDLSYVYSANPDSEYSLRVHAQNSAGETMSNTVTVTTDAVIEPVTAPVLSIGAVDTDSIDLSWTNSENATNYDILVLPPNGSSYILEANITGTSFIFQAESDSQYSFKIVAKNSEYQAESNVETVTTDVVVVEPSYDNEETLTYMQTQNIPENDNASSYPGKTNNDLWLLFDDVVSYWKANGVWSKLIHWHPMLGAGAVERGYNALDTSAFYMTFNGGWIFNTMGNVGNGTNTYARFGLIVKDYLALENTGMTLVSSQAGVKDNVLDLGSGADINTCHYLGISRSGLANVAIGKRDPRFSNNIKVGVFSGIRINGAAKFYIDGVKKNEAPKTGGGLPFEKQSVYGAAEFANNKVAVHSDKTLSSVLHHTGDINVAALHQGLAMWEEGLGRL
jgi:hypothetical protein